MSLSSAALIAQSGFSNTITTESSVLSRNITGAQQHLELFAQHSQYHHDALWLTRRFHLPGNELSLSLREHAKCDVRQCNANCIVLWP